MNDNYSIIIHGKHNHEETKATFSLLSKRTSLIIKDFDEVKLLVDFIEEKNLKLNFTPLLKENILRVLTSKKT